MAYVITEECLACGSCAGECPAGAIAEGAEIFTITEECLECGSCVDVCPAGAIIEK